MRIQLPIDPTEIFISVLSQCLEGCITAIAAWPIGLKVLFAALVVARIATAMRR
ncbi:hypothetical protein HED60_14105 [Planctomycetales bacterium ZRK34]|nr:hypothetical protein HED60_14105 [Planctomycetales bacterium ZRK34]